MKQNMQIYGLLLLAFLFLLPSNAQAHAGYEAGEELNIKEFILDHLADSYEWQIVSDGKRHLTIPLPVILHSKNTG